MFTDQARGEEEVHGSVAPWVAWSADFAAGPGVSGPATIIIAAPGAAEAGEPWFVRVRELPRIGSALAWDQPVLILRAQCSAAVSRWRLLTAAWAKTNEGARSRSGNTGQRHKHR